MHPNPNLLLFLGRFHPLLVHLPIGFVVLLVALETLARTPWFRGANAGAGYILALLVPSALASAGCGWLLAGAGDYDAEILRLHRWLGLATASLGVIVTVFHYLQKTRAYVVCLALNALVLGAASHFGGSLTHGSDYLTRYAPAPIRAWLPRPAARLHPADHGLEPGVFPALVQPILRDRCEACHNAEKHKGGLRLDSLERLLLGGTDGPVAVAGNAAESPMIQRLLLPPETDDHMPPDGKPQPRAEEIAVLRWWINAGLPSNAALSGLHPPPEIQQAVERLKKKSN